MVEIALHLTIVYTQVYKLNYEETVNNTTNIEELHINDKCFMSGGSFEKLSLKISIND